MIETDGPLAVQRILEQRAQALARSVEDAASAAKTVALVELAIGGERFGVDLQQIQEVQPLHALTPIPGVPAFWAGVVNLRGRLFPVLDLRRYLRLSASGRPEGGHIVVVGAAGLSVAIWASDVVGVQRIADADIQTSVLDDSEAPRRVVAGVTADLLSVLDLEALLSDPELIVQESASS
jgi:purine-binding chemotaxis protein CheW